MHREFQFVHSHLTWSSEEVILNHVWGSLAGEDVQKNAHVSAYAHSTPLYFQTIDVSEK